MIQEYNKQKCCGLKIGVTDYCNSVRQSMMCVYSAFTHFSLFGTDNE